VYILGPDVCCNYDHHARCRKNECCKHSMTMLLVFPHTRIVQACSYHAPETIHIQHKCDFDPCCNEELNVGCQELSIVIKVISQHLNWLKWKVKDLISTCIQMVVVQHKIFRVKIFCASSTNWTMNTTLGVIYAFLVPWCNHSNQGVTAAYNIDK
jgi:hypothetical protein